jgi:ABC-type branched-subunit amino acid transport system substrate-binding protein
MVNARTSGTRARRHALGAAALAVMALLASCTTVTRTSMTRTDGRLATSSGEPGAVADEGTGTSDAAGPAGDSVGPAGSSGSAADAGSGAVASGDTTGGGPGTAAAGQSCSKTIRLGVSYSSDLAAGLSAVGNPSAASQAGDFVKQQQAIYQRTADDVNQRGGLAGCKVQLVFHDFKSLGAGGFSGESQSECADFAEDKHVFAVITGALENRTLITCLAQHKTPVLFNSSQYNPTTPDYKEYRGYLYQPGYINPDRWGPYIDQYNAAGYFDKGAKVGILLADNGYGSNQRLVEQIWKPRLAALGITPVVFTFKMITGYSDVSGVTSQFNSAVLQFRSQGVTHVMTTPDAGDAVIFFTQVASSQNYHPRYALSTLSAAQAWETEPADQRPRAVAISFTSFDLGPTPNPTQAATNPASKARSDCDALFKGRNGSTPMTSIYPVCDQMNFLQAALRGASDVTPAALLAGVEKLGNTLPLAAGYANAKLGPGVYDGGSATRAMLWDEPSKMWKYVSPPTPVP